MVSYHNKKVKKILENSGSSSAWRFYGLIFFILFCLGAIIFRLYWLQVNAYGFYREMADGQHMLREKILPKRGEIFMQEKGGLFPAAVNREMATIYAVPREIENREQLIPKLSQALALDENEVRVKLLKENDLYEVLKRKASPEEEERIKKLNEKGIYITQESWRYYPGGTLAAQTVGFVGYNQDKIEGRYGIESYFEERLRGNHGILQQEKDTGGRWISIGAKSITPASNGKKLVLSLDHIIEFKAEQILKNAVERHHADSGKIIIMEPYSGKILAMAAEPSFNLNDYSKTEDVNVFRNPIVNDSYECGSIFKPFTMAAGLDTGQVSAESTYVDTGAVVEAGYTIKNSDGKANGVQTMTNVIEKSLNTGVIHVEKLVGNDRFLQYIKDFGFGEKSGIELPHESAGNISNLKTNRNIEFFTASFGQGITVTPLQLATAYAAIANGGELLKPQVLDYLEDVQGQQKIEREVKRRVISKNTANQLALMLESNVLNGHGKLAGVPGYRVGGKTGTAQIPDKEKGGYKENANVGSFAGFAPIDNPRFVMVVAIENPKDVVWAESSAGPVFGEMARFLFDYYGIEPTEEYTTEDLEKFEKTHNYIDTETQEDKNSVVPIVEQTEKDSPKEEKDKDKKKKKK